MPRADSARILRLRPIWSHLELGYPIERPDLLDRTKIFADIHRRSSFALDSRVVPIIDVTPVREQVQTLYASISQDAGGAGLFSACELANGPFNTVICRPHVIVVQNIGVASKPQLEIRTHEALGGAPTAVNGANVDGRRGTPGPAGQAQLRASASAGNAVSDPRIVLPNGPQIIGPDDGFLEDIVIAPGEDLVVVDSTANENLEISVIWTEEPFIKGTRP